MADAARVALVVTFVVSAVLKARSWRTLPDAMREVIVLHYTGGLTLRQTADVLGISPATLKRRWALARAWLFRELGGDAT